MKNRTPGFPNADHAFRRVATKLNWAAGLIISCSFFEGWKAGKIEGILLDRDWNRPAAPRRPGAPGCAELTRDRAGTRYQCGMKSAVFLVISLCTAGAMESFQGSALIATDWADGDSFRVKTAGGREFSLRLYGVDCIETGPYDPSDARRLRDQRQYFGISNHGGSFRSSVELAERYGREAATRVADWLGAPFTVHTAFADARGDARYERFYGFITLGDGRDLGAALVSAGLARAFGVLRGHPDGRSADEYGQSLADLEIQAAVRRKGIWEHTDWERLPEERRLSREYEEEIRTTIRRPVLEEGTRIDLNTAARDELMRLPGIGEVMALRIVEGRPYKTPGDLIRVRGIGEATLERISPFLHVAEAEAE